ncbi:MAG: DUF2142 domain-containing protein [Lachnospiraceae bacterium]|nr:DUF2142 domain-containing protein [Lachnospiraceae bacterium]
MAVRKGTVIRLVLLLAAAVLIAVLANVWENRAVLRLPEEERGVYALDMSRITAESAQEAPGGGWTLSEGSSLTVPSGLLPAYVDKIYYIADHDMKADAVLTVTDGFGREKTFADHVPQYLRTSFVPVEGAADSVRLAFTFTPDGSSGTQVTVREIGVSNRFQWNAGLFVFWILAALALGGIWALWGVLKDRPDRAFLWLCLTLGTLLVLLLPANKAGWDEEIHYYRALTISVYPKGLTASHADVNEMRVTIANWPYNQPDGEEEQRAFERAANALDAATRGAHTQTRYLARPYTSGYLTQALFLKIAHLVRMPFSAAYRFGRWGNLLGYALLMFFAIRAVPIGKRVLAGAALMPTPLFLAATYSYDAAVIGFLSLGMALVLREILREEGTVSWGTFLLAGAAFVLGILPKAIYAPIVLTALLIPNKRFADKKQLYLMKGAVILAFLALIGTFVLPMLSGGDYMSDSRGGDTSSGSQLSHILADPVGYAKLLLGSIFGTMPRFLLGYPIYGQLGHLPVSPARWAFPVIVLGSLFADAPEKKGQLTWLQRFIFLLLTGTCMVLIWTALYMSYTPVGAPYIAGVQPRYYLPLLLPVFAIFFTDRLKPQKGGKWITAACLGAASAVTLWTAWACIYVPFAR